MLTILLALCAALLAFVAGYRYALHGVATGQVEVQRIYALPPDGM